MPARRSIPWSSALCIGIRLGVAGSIAGRTGRLRAGKSMLPASAAFAHRSIFRIVGTMLVLPARLVRLPENGK